ncbi:hypothetical protein CRUP_024499 [Coryphaenoides rupestris]|nr:hypothetical protein CRUP_024499 [Coryphaenoides rupestris]
MNGRAFHPLIPEDGECPDPPRRGVDEDPGVIRFGDGGEAEVAVSKSQRRKSDVKVYKDNMANALANAMCERCKGSFAPAEKIVNSNGELYHEHLKAENTVSTTSRCYLPHAANSVAHGLGKYMCQKCHAIIEDQPLLFKNDPYHPDHFSCNNCGKELTWEARELKGELYCLPCHDKMGVPICGACRRPIEGRVVNAMGKQWHVEHFVCAKCEKPFLGHRHYERKGLAYCETHYNQLFGDVCYHCNRVIEGDGRYLEMCQNLYVFFIYIYVCVCAHIYTHIDKLMKNMCVFHDSVVSALNKAWCVSCFACSTCNTKLTLKDKFVEVDLKPVCKHCYDRMPEEMRYRLAKTEHNSKDKKKKLFIPMCL